MDPQTEILARFGGFWPFVSCRSRMKRNLSHSKPNIWINPLYWCRLSIIQGPGTSQKGILVRSIKSYNLFCPSLSIFPVRKSLIIRKDLRLLTVLSWVRWPGWALLGGLAVCGSDWEIDTSFPLLNYIPCTLMKTPIGQVKCAQFINISLLLQSLTSILFYVDLTHLKRGKFDKMGKLISYFCCSLFNMC